MMADNNNNLQMRTVGSIALYLLSAVMLFLDWFSAPYGMVKLSLLEMKSLAKNVDGAEAAAIGSLIITGVAILIAIVGVIGKKRSYGIAAPIAAVITLLVAVWLCSEAEGRFELTAAPFLALVFAAAGLLIAPATTSTQSVSAQPVRTGGVLVAESGDYAGAEFELSDGETLVLGRDPAMCSIVFEDYNVSRQHCAIRYNAAENRYYVTDLSSNGTFLEDGIRLQPQTETAVERGEKVYLSNQKDVFILG